MEIPWPAWFLPYHPYRLVRSARSWRQRRRLGLGPLRTPPVTSIPVVDREAFSRSGYRPQPVADLPYEQQAMDYVIVNELLNLDDVSIELDDGGVVVWRDSRGVGQNHPVYLVQYALAALGGFTRTGDRRYMDRAVVNAERLITLAEPDENGDLWFPYHFPHQYYDVTMPVPWWSSMGQGQPLSLFSRLAGLLPEDVRWRPLADATFRTFNGWRALGQPWVTTMDTHGCLWFEEYAGDVEPLLVLNGHVFALYGLYDYAMLTGDALAVELFDGGSTTVREHFDTIRVPGGISYYCARDGYCQRPEWQNVAYHPIHIQQMRMLAAMTGDAWFGRAADLLTADAEAQIT
ncbi:hypothetical protein BH11ACT3_BH11ACT3_06670 [soil metagenome]